MNTEKIKYLRDELEITQEDNIKDYWVHKNCIFIMENKQKYNSFTLLII